MSEHGKITGNGQSKWTVDMSKWPWWGQAAYVVMAKFGIWAFLFCCVAVCATWWSIKVTVPESEARRSLIKQTADALTASNLEQKKLAVDQAKLAELAQKLLELVGRVVDNEAKLLQNEQSQTLWQQEWKAYISEQHVQRGKEAALIIEGLEKQRLFQERTDQHHDLQSKMMDRQMEVMDGILDELKAIRKEQWGTPKNQPPLPKSGSESKG